MKKLFIISIVLLTFQIQAQVGINTTTPNSQLDIRSSNQAAPSNNDGILIPKVDVFPATNPTTVQQGMLVYLTTISGTDLPGFYYWDNTTVDWKPIAGTSIGTLDQAYDFGGAGNGRTITADTGAVLINGTDGFHSTGILNSGATLPISGAGVKMLWYPRKSAFRAGRATSTQWDDTNIGLVSTAFGSGTIASANNSTAFGTGTTASNTSTTAFGLSSIASGDTSTAFGSGSTASGQTSTSFGGATTASGATSTAFGSGSIASGQTSTAFGVNNVAESYGETVIGIRATQYTPSTNGATQFRTANATDRLFTIGNAIDTNNNGTADAVESSDAMIVLKNGLTRLPSTTNALITAADGKAVVTKEYLQSNTSGSLDQAYDFGGAGSGRTITADAGPVLIDGTDGFISTGTIGSGIILPNATGARMIWYPRKAAFRAGITDSTQWDEANIGDRSIAFGRNTTASGENSTASGFLTTASGQNSTAFGWVTIASGNNSTAFGFNNETSGITSTAFGSTNIANGLRSTVFGYDNTSSSKAETTIGIGATIYTPTTNGEIEFRTANATDRLFVIGNAIDANSNSMVDNSERSDAMVVLKNGNTGIGTSTPLRKLHIATGTSGGTPFVNSNVIFESNGDAYQQFLTPNTLASTGSGLLFGTPAGSIRGGIIFASLTESLDFRAGGNIRRMIITNTGDVGIGTVFPGGQLELSLNEGRKPGTNTWTIVSDSRLKTINGIYTKGLSEILQLNPIRYNYKNAGERIFEKEVLDTEFPGFIAQEVQPFFPDAVGTDADGFLNFNIHPILIASVNAIKELNNKNQSLQEENELLKLQLETLLIQQKNQESINKTIIERLNALETKN